MAQFEQYPLGPGAEPTAPAPADADGRWVVAVIRDPTSGTEFLEADAGSFTREDVVALLDRLAAGDDDVYPLGSDAIRMRISDTELLVVEQGFFSTGPAIRIVAGRLG